MHPTIQEIDDLYMQHYGWRENLDFLAIQQLPLDEQLQIQEELNRRLMNLPNTTPWIETLESLRLTPNEIIEAYNGVTSSYFRRYFTGRIVRNFDQIYLPTMIEAIEEDEPSAYLFVSRLTQWGYKEVTRQISLIALKSRYEEMREHGVALVQEHKVIEAIPRLNELLTIPNAYGSIDPGGFIQRAIDELEAIANSL